MLVGWNKTEPVQIDWAAFFPHEVLLGMPHVTGYKVEFNSLEVFGEFFFSIESPSVFFVSILNLFYA